MARLPFYLRCLIAAAVLVFGLPSQSFGDHVCVYDEATKTVTVGDPTEESILVVVGEHGDIRTSEGACGIATRFNTDTIEITLDSPGVQQVTLYGIEYDFAPGFTNEPGNSDEIEIYLDLSEEDGFGFLGREGPDVRAGSAPSTGFTRLNLNADESEGVDADVLADASLNRVSLGVGNVDRLSARLDAGGGAGTGTHYSGRAGLSGSFGDDVLIGGLRIGRLWGSDGNDRIVGNDSRDRVRAGAGADVIFGAGGNDRLVALGQKDEIHGGTGDDVLSGGDGDDHLFGGEGTDSLDGKKGRDVCNGGPGDDDFFSCEEHD